MPQQVIEGSTNEQRGTMKGLWIGLGLVAVLLIGAVFIGGSYISAKNTMVQKDQAVTAAFSEIDVNLQRRADLIPNLVATVKGYAKQELAVFTAIANARAGLLTAKTPDEKLAANDRLSVALLPLTRMQETYPDLKSNGQFLRLEDELAGTENRIAVARRGYNKAIEDYNVYIGQFPASIWANMAGYHPRTGYYQADPGAKTAPSVDFNK
ncbi:LemA family protein [Terriglobus saanensis]|uniref:LemA family protein n=1 Tax=Terriglobus saanensis (strain ATCC BAA-1853 / DSM 23119 / SP1PR4) TaxID=401053 RepID=E8V108_TERSS|nr:LemA family protein [Terriglobus saanensis]ADV83356.1 LemA family protein [Terriglobus saanensis SP1PR4]